MKYAVVIPVFRSSIVLESLVADVLSLDIPPNEIILVWDWGVPEAWRSCCEMASIHNSVRSYQMTRNYGQHNATIAGFSLVSADVDWVVTMDEDYQHDPRVIHELLMVGSQGFDVVYAEYHQPRFSFVRRTLSNLLNQSLRWGLPGLPSSYSSFRLIERGIASELPKFKNSYAFLDGYLTWCTSSFGSVTIEHLRSRENESGYSLAKLFWHAVNIFVAFSALPLRIITLFGGLALVAGTAVSSWAILRKQLHPDVVLPGYTSFLVITCFGVGLILFALGVVSEYIYRINLKSSMAPSFLIRANGEDGSS